jgi:antitoxin (DNA-binding transcriptional repressor) of toxin-antitoxin stability system
LVREARQQFSRILRDVEAGAEILVTRRASPWRIVPAQSCRERRLTSEQEAAHARSMERLREGWGLGRRQVQLRQAVSRLNGSRSTPTSSSTPPILLPASATSELLG